MPCYSGQRATTAEAHAAAYAELVKRQCATGRHVLGCKHRPAAPFILRALLGALPAKELAR